MGILGNVETGWFAKLAHGVEWTARKTLNVMSLGHGWGDSFFRGQRTHVVEKVERLNEEAIARSVKSGATPQQALGAGSQAMDRVADPQSVEDMAALAGIAVDANVKTIKDLVTPKTAAGNPLALLLIGAGVLGGAYLAVDSLLSSPASPRSTKRKRQSTSL